jgi:hypothetical protein
MVWQRFAKSPRIACAGSTPAASANLSGHIEQQHWFGVNTSRSQPQIRDL